MLTLEQALEFYFVCDCGHRNEIDFIKAYSPQMAINLKKRAELEWHIRQNELRLEHIQHEKESLQLDLCELNQLRIEREIEQLKLAKID